LVEQMGMPDSSEWVEKAEETYPLLYEMLAFPQWILWLFNPGHYCIIKEKGLQILYDKKDDS
jgi:hypothetical protein